MKERLKELRTTFNLTQKDFADRLEVDQSLVAKWERGDRPIMPQQIKLLCYEFGVSRVWLETGAGEMFESESYDDKLYDYIVAQYESLPPRKQEAALIVLKRMIDRGQWLRKPDDPFIEQTQKRFFPKQK